MAEFRLKEDFSQSVNVEQIRASFSHLKALGPEGIKKVYEIVFSDYPQSAPLFTDVNWPTQHRKVLESLDYVIQNLETDEPSVRRFLFDLGQRHLEYGATEFSYDWVGNALIKAVASFCDEGWNAGLADEWRNFFIVVKTLMIAGHTSAKLKT